MSTNTRIFYACQGVSITNHGDTQVTEASMVHGLQSVGTNTSFNLEQAFELGQVEIYENIEGLPDVEVTLEKLIDGYPLIYHLASTGIEGNSPGASGLVSRSKERCDLRLGIFDEAQNNIAGGAQDAEVEVYCSGMYIGSIAYNIPVDGNATESVTLVGNNKLWLTGASTQIKDADIGEFDGDDRPFASGYGGIQRREDVLLEHSILPVGIRGVNGSGVGNAQVAGIPVIHLQSFNVSTEFGREDVLELGRKTPYTRPADFPIEVTCEIEAITTSGDFIAAYEDGDPALYADPVTSGNNTGEESIYIRLRAGYGFDLGTKNRLSNVSYGGGDADGGNVTTTYSYANFNDFDVQSSGITGPGGSTTFTVVTPFGFNVL